ncbi:hypothetical protein EGR_05446 [Echinococcus granulosus]|uniref:Uncharacterized protein n=1 Tax=Echinococcus granulosus TaxID=6210 RepID=W6V1E3_ECHGR|nr:hypothetical protein EGR_05446 [Echinococcus granulosus]EUB59684.1 hypothetical protein EGR_05446 [Echinococcus granulosus]
MPSSSFSTYNMTYTTEMEESSGNEDRPDVIRNSQGETKFDFCFSPIQMQRPKSPQMMSAVYEVTEPLSERTNVFDTKMHALANHKEGGISPIQNTPKAWQVADIGEPDDGEVDENIPITPKDHLLRNSERMVFFFQFDITNGTIAVGANGKHVTLISTENGNRKVEVELAVNMSPDSASYGVTKTEVPFFTSQCSPSKEISEGSDDFDCSSGETSPPIMRLYMPKDGHGVRAVCSPRYEQEVQWKSTQTENVLLTVDKGTQTVEECEVPVYPDVTDNADATRLKEWIEELFKHKLPRADSQNSNARQKLGAIAGFTADYIVRTAEADDGPTLQVDTGHAQLTVPCTDNCTAITKTEAVDLQGVAEVSSPSYTAIDEGRNEQKDKAIQEAHGSLDFVKMDQKIIYVIIAIISAILFFFAIGFNGWSCGGSIFSDTCLISTVNEVTGALLLTAGLLVLLGGIFLIVLVVKGDTWANIVATVVVIIAALLSLAGVLYYLDQRELWSPFLASVAMSFTMALAAILVADLATGGGRSNDKDAPICGMLAFIPVLPLAFFLL